MNMENIIMFKISVVTVTTILFVFQLKDIYCDASVNGISGISHSSVEYWDSQGKTLEDWKDKDFSVITAKDAMKNVVGDGYGETSKLNEMPFKYFEQLITRLDDSISTALGFLSASIMVVAKVGDIFKEPLVVSILLLPPVLLFTIITSIFLPELERWSHQF